MGKAPVIFALASPEPEILPDQAKTAGARIVGTGRPDFGNQIDNVLAFPGIYRGMLDAEATEVTEAMKVAAAFAIARMVPDRELNEEHILPSVFREGLAASVAKAVASAWTKRPYHRSKNFE
jgi:malate dehydrogenase (oxaloacetate-decarboxylating)